jgi:hypothetical protein
MYCPKCGATLVTHWNARRDVSYLYCEQGEMRLQPAAKDACMSTRR